MTAESNSEVEKVQIHSVLNPDDTVAWTPTMHENLLIEQRLKKVFGLIAGLGVIGLASSVATEDLVLGVVSASSLLSGVAGLYG